MGTYDYETFYETFGGEPLPGEAHPSAEAIDNARKTERENAHVLGDRPSTGLPSRRECLLPGWRESGGCDACGAGPDDECAPGCETNR